MQKQKTLQSAALKENPSATLPRQALKRERPNKGLTKIQEELAELASDMLMNGGERADVELFLRALCRHRYRRFVSTLKSIKVNEQEVEERGGRDIANEYSQLAKGWRDRKPAKRSSQTAELPTTVVEFARACIRREVEHQFAGFMANMEGIEAAWILNEIFEHCNANSTDLAQAITAVFESDEAYIRVPYGIEDEVRNFIKLLEKRTL